MAGLIAYADYLLRLAGKHLRRKTDADLQEAGWLLRKARSVYRYVSQRRKGKVD